MLKTGLLYPLWHLLTLQLAHSCFLYREMFLKTMANLRENDMYELGAASGWRWAGLWANMLKEGCWCICTYPMHLLLSFSLVKCAAALLDFLMRLLWCRCNQRQRSTPGIYGNPSFPKTTSFPQCSHLAGLALTSIKAWLLWASCIYHGCHRKEIHYLYKKGVESK